MPLPRRRLTEQRGDACQATRCDSGLGPAVPLSPPPLRASAWPSVRPGTGLGHARLSPVADGALLAVALLPWKAAAVRSPVRVRSSLTLGSWAAALCCAVRGSRTTRLPWVHGVHSADAARHPYVDSNVGVEGSFSDLALSPHPSRLAGCLPWLSWSAARSASSVAQPSFVHPLIQPSPPPRIDDLFGPHPRFEADHLIKVDGCPCSLHLPLFCPSMMRSIVLSGGVPSRRSVAEPSEWAV